MGRLSRQVRPIVSSGPTKAKPPKIAPTLKDLLPEGRLNQFYRKLGRRVALVQDRVDLHHLERGHYPGVRNDLHDEMGLPVIQPTLDRSTDTGSYGRVHCVEIQAHMHEVRAGRNLGQRLFHDTGDPMPVDVGHGMNLHAGLFQPLLLSAIEATNSDQRHVGRVYLGSGPSDTGELRSSKPEQGCERHSVNVSRG